LKASRIGQLQEKWPGDLLGATASTTAPTPPVSEATQDYLAGLKLEKVSYQGRRGNVIIWLESVA
jgi:hypothetical protein